MINFVGLFQVIGKQTKNEQNKVHLTIIVNKRNLVILEQDELDLEQNLSIVEVIEVNVTVVEMVHELSIVN